MTLIQFADAFAIAITFASRPSVPYGANFLDDLSGTTIASYGRQQQLILVCRVQANNLKPLHASLLQRKFNSFAIFISFFLQIMK